MACVNRLADITLVVGFIGSFKGSKNQIERQIQALNAEGWEVHQYIKGSKASFGTMLKQALTLLITLGFYSKMNVATLLLKKER